MTDLATSTAARTNRPGPAGQALADLRHVVGLSPHDLRLGLKVDRPFMSAYKISEAAGDRDARLGAVLDGRVVLAKVVTRRVVAVALERLASDDVLVEGLAGADALATVAASVECLGGRGSSLTPPSWFGVPGGVVLLMALLRPAGL